MIARVALKARQLQPAAIWIVASLFVTACPGPSPFDVQTSACDALNDIGLDAGDIPADSVDAPFDGDVLDAVVDQADATVERPPRLVYPPSFGVVTSRRPTFRFLRHFFGSTHMIELCADRACTRHIESVLTDSDHGQPLADLPSGVVFWRVRRVAEGEPVDPSSAVWQIVVRRASAPVDSVTNTVFDPNGDGYSDLPIMSADAVSVVYVGGSHGLTRGASTIPYHLPMGPGLGLAPANVGDVNGDGYSDFAIGDGDPFHSRGRVTVYYGSATGIDTSRSSLLEPGELDVINMLGEFVESGDVNADGYSDVLASCQSREGPCVAWFPGGPDGPPTTPMQIRDGVLRSSLPVQEYDSLAGGGDLNGDGFADAVIRIDSSPSRFYVFLGGLTGLSDHALIVDAPAPDEGTTPSGPRFVGDLNGDGYSDIAYAIGNETIGQARVLYGGVDGISAARQTLLPMGADSATELDSEPESAGDLNGDGYDDLAFGNPFAVTATAEPMGSANIFAGSASGVSPTPSMTYRGDPAAGGAYGDRIIGSGRDFNGDGLADIAVSSAEVNPDGTVGSVRIYNGSIGSLPSYESTIIRLGAGAVFFRIAAGQSDQRGLEADLVRLLIRSGRGDLAAIERSPDRTWSL